MSNQKPKTGGRPATNRPKPQILQNPPHTKTFTRPKPGDTPAPK